jgi:hypothetical protein
MEGGWYLGSCDGGVVEDGLGCADSAGHVLEYLSLDGGRGTEGTVKSPVPRV